MQTKSTSTTTIATAMTLMHPEAMDPVALGILIIFEQNVTKLIIVLTLTPVQIKQPIIMTQKETISES